MATRRALLAFPGILAVATYAMAGKGKPNTWKLKNMNDNVAE